MFLLTSNELTAESARLTKATKMEDHVQVRAVDVARAWEERCVMYEVARSFCQSVGVWVHVKVSWVTGGGCSAALARTVSKATIALEARERSAGRWASSCTTQSCNRVDTDAIVVVVVVMMLLLTSKVVHASIAAPITSALPAAHVMC